MRARIADFTSSAAEGVMQFGEKGGYGTTLRDEDFVWGSNGVAMNQSMVLLVAQRLGADKKCREGAASNLHYVLGRNCWGTSWVTGVGQRAFMKPHHRPSAADAIEAPWPGLMSGGPNARPADERAKQVKAAPPMRMWVDATEAYSMNEVAINWNAPLVFVLAALAE